MIVRIFLILFISGASAVCYLAGYVRLMSGLLLGFASLVSVFFGALFVVPEENRELWFPVYGDGAAWPFFLLALLLVAIAALLFNKRQVNAPAEILSSVHYKYGIGAFVTSLLSVFLPVVFWFPSDDKRLSIDSSALGEGVLLGTCIYLIGTILSLFLFYRASKGGKPNNPDFMRRVVLALFSMLHFDKLPAFVAFLLIYSPETQIIYPSIAALALAAYIPVGLFLLKISSQCQRME
ncbi:MAG: hypothetical protein V2I36_17985 [Desulfopila sp.]|jgi:hypothetical protein|nr:hypothetical protein [Desulfopila sp.]